MIHLNKEMRQKLDIRSVNNQSYTKCLIRNLEIAIDSRPEELVRQLFIHYLTKESTLLQRKIEIKVESNNHDIEIYKLAENSNFKPYQSPTVIVEVKREDVNLQNHYAQIQRYLIKSNCKIGILYNYHKTILFLKKDDDFETNQLANFREVEEILLKVSNIVNPNLLEFEKAQKGDFESFTYLISKYGKYTTNTIVFKLKTQQPELKGYFFNVQGNRIYYDICGQYSRNQQFFERQDFERLVAIKY
ncbi:type I restriction enzyme HsdR N-terminal domain-containing protein [Aliterella atlantica]|uniref:Type I restriction enzyme R protein N-terminal domain-containing protein n=1 Tax=Aliterella atlantica CENA595 TaxID=1618023 RepID=A0A0D8ZQ42_9CYAN|nr:type I restriction enzyme HsdR N-terminal domain-containing protein [Aliterella atlantica]KJH70467.1 hypothetical protein UH38_17770 [Aliterella atlantica CENA595]